MCPQTVLYLAADPGHRILDLLLATINQPWVRPQS
jgi:hypothetical protein